MIYLPQDLSFSHQTSTSSAKKLAMYVVGVPYHLFVLCHIDRFEQVFPGVNLEGFSLQVSKSYIHNFWLFKYNGCYSDQPENLWEFDLHYLKMIELEWF